uniref:Uncharacterized protein n=1 Tax=Rhizophora mucronata TaxID=61149 RepID=A0A2P2QC33_RHIMU
MRIDTFRETK